ncbi:MAG: transposase [Candidatus Cloacimonadota bacterium]|nr:transposase [Candidatus Cloacimonadota bacterium]
MGLRGRSNFTDENCFFITTSVVNHLKVFHSNVCCDLLIDNIKHYQAKYHFNILGYVIMPSHFHWIIRTENKYGTISDIMRDIKKYSAWDIMGEIGKKGDQNLDKIFKNYANKYPDQKRKFWNKRFDDVVIRSRKFFLQKLQYIHNNPVKANLVKQPEDYKYSSARNYKYDDHSIIFIDTD